MYQVIPKREPFLKSNPEVKTVGSRDASIPSNLHIQTFSKVKRYLQDNVI
jgi:hypothetical protein